MDNITNITNANAATERILQSSRFWIQRVFVPLMVCIGIAGNTVTVMVLTRRRMRSSTNIYLSALAIADIIYLFFVFLLSFTHSDIEDIKYELYWRFYGLSRWLCDAASNTSVWLTVSFTIERYIAVCHPMKRKLFCTENRAKTIIVIVYIFCTITVASTAFENQLNLNETCSHCPVPRSTSGNIYNISDNNSQALPKQDNTQSYIFLDTPRSNAVNNSSLIVQFINNTRLQTFLKSLLSNCSNEHLHVVFVFPNIFNATNENLVDSDITKGIVVSHGVNENLMEKLQKNNSDYDDENSINKTEKTVKCKCKSTVGVELTNLGKNKTYKSFINWYSALVFALIPLTLISTFNCLLIRAVYLSQRKRKAMTSSQDDPSNTNISNENRITIMLISVIVMFLICQTPTASLLIYQNFINEEDTTSHYIFGNFFNFLLTINASCNFLLYSTMSKKFRSTFKKLFFERGKNRQDTIVLSSTKSRSSQKFNPAKHGIRRNASEYHTPRNLETQSLTGMPRTKSLMTRAMGTAKSTDVVF